MANKPDSMCCIGNRSVTDDRDDLDRVRAERPDDGVVAVLVGAQDAVRVVVRAGHQARQVGRVGRQVRPGELIGSAHVLFTSGPFHLLRSSVIRDSCGMSGMLMMWATACPGSMRM